jgi:hypothetical protein
MTMQTVTVSLPESVYLRLQQVAQGTQQSLTDVLLHAVKVGSPPSWEDVPAEFQVDLAALDRLDDDSLWQIARSKQSDDDMVQYQALLDKNADGTISEFERLELTQLRVEFDRLMLRKAHAAALLRWRGYQLPPSDKL